MYDNTIKDKFVELRAAGQSFGQISEQLGVVKSTLHRWEEEREADIARLRRIQWEEWETEASCRIENRLEDLACNIADYEMRLGDFKLNHLSLRDTVMLLRESRREYFRLRALLMGTPSRPRKSVGSVPSVVNPESNKTERFQENGNAEPLITSDLQQRNPESFDFGGTALHGNACGESQTSRQASDDPPTPSADAVRDSSTADSGSATRSHGADSETPSIPLSAPPRLCGESESEKSNKIERFTENGTTAPLITNDLRQSKPNSFDSPSAVHSQFSAF